jgi:undecaprenyl-diphosphatase
LVHAVTRLLAAYVALSGILIVAGLLLTHELPQLVRWDESVSGWVVAHRTRSLDSLAHWGTFVANTQGIATVAILVTLVLLARRAGPLTALVPCGLSLELAVFLTVNEVVRRPRPAVPHLGPTPSTWSFPSGHCAASLVLYGSIAVVVAVLVRNPVARLAALALALVVPLCVAFSRLYSGQHHLLDVLAGLATGLGVLAAAVLAAVPRIVRVALDRSPVAAGRAGGDNGLPPEGAEVVREHQTTGEHG